MDDDEAAELQRDKWRWCLDTRRANVSKSALSFWGDYKAQQTKLSTMRVTAFT